MTVTLEITRMLTISTGHLSPTTAQALEAICEAHNEPQMLGSAAVNGYSHGWQVSVPTEGWDSCPPELAPAFRLATENGCTWVQYDMDGDVIPQLEVFDW